MAYNPTAQPAQAYAVEGGQGYHQPSAPQQPYGAQPQVHGQAVVAQPYNGPTAQQAVVGQAGNQQQHVIVVRQGGGGAAQIPPPNHCCISVLSLFCCLPIGIFAVCMSCSVDSKWRRGDFDGANSASHMAKKAAILAIMLGLVWSIFTSVYEVNVDGTDDDDDRFGGQ
ncbi:conserved unknown protein [Ectocarpus siliculosus]|uniref:Uncharacterized protein n=1 Tax=Ectocarpus siliculosus TaxID=2880 RepID=D7FXB4_ECTSI|nr:conserved unknown protein [Ectocarpus siliculosus]|eukprot:CBJ32251.1 conserved unknown protein [Ectocarpus siliculosus]